MMARRKFLETSLGGAALAAGATGPTRAAGSTGFVQPSGPTGARAASSAADLRIRRLSWAGVKLEAEDVTLFVDPWEESAFFGDRFPGVPIEVTSETRRRYIALTHLHRDHFDRTVARRLLTGDVSGSLVVESGVAAEAASEGLRVFAQELWSPRVLGPFTVTPLPAVDGWGTRQVAWSIRMGDVRLFHGGDGLWHGWWWDIARAFGPFDIAFLPINGVRTPGAVPAVGVARTLDPEHAAEAASALGARRVVPIHYGVSVPGIYEESPDAEAAFLRHASRLGVTVDLVAAGERVELP